MGCRLNLSSTISGRVEQRNHRPVVSIILCTFNRAGLIARAIDSVLRQDFKSFELIVIDDGSSDETYGVVLQIAREDSRCIYMCHHNRGLSASRNAGISLARGKYVTFLDSDDEYRRAHIAKRLEYLERRPDVDAIYGGVHCIGPRSKQYVVDLTSQGHKVHVSKCFVGGTLFARRKVLEKVGGFPDFDFGEDYHLMLKLKKKFNVRRVSWPTYIYHTDAPDRLCDLFEKGGSEAITDLRKGSLVGSAMRS